MGNARWVVTTFVTGIVALTTATLAPADYAWLVQYGSDAATGRQVYAVAPGGGTPAVTYAPAIPDGTFIAGATVDATGRLIYHASTSLNRMGPMYYGHVGTSECAPAGDDSNAAGKVVWRNGTDEFLYSCYSTGIKAMTIGGGDQSTLTTNYFDEVLSITPAGMVFFENSLYREPGDIFTMDLQGNNITEWTPTGTHHERNACVSPDGQYVAFQQQNFDGLYLATVEGTVINGTENPLVPDVPRRNENQGWLAWSPDSQTLAFAQNDAVWSVNRDGSGLAELTDPALAGFDGPMVWGSVVVPEPLPGDLNCDAVVNFADINPFVLALTNPFHYPDYYPNCDIYNADLNSDGYVDFGDINPFVALLTGF